VDVSHSLDVAAGGPVLVFGSAPPRGRDLDLLARPSEYSAIERALESGGFVRRGHGWVKFHGCGVASVDLIPATDWSLPAGELKALFEEARPIEGYENLVRPAPHHALLILALRVERAGRFESKLRNRATDASAEDPRAWDIAGMHAPGWRAEDALRRLRAAYNDGSVRMRGPGIRFKAWALLRKRGIVVALSGLDGAGKSSQAEALIATLDRLGVEATSVWTRLSYNPSLDVIAAPVKKIVGRGGHSSSSEEASSRVDPAKEARRRSPLLNYGWASIVALANGVTHRRKSARFLRRGVVVICDRYLLDSAVHLRYRYGETKSFRLPDLILRVVSPRPAAAFFINVPPEEALARKAEQYDLDQLTRQAGLYEANYVRWGYERLDGCSNKDELCERIARAVWESLQR